jgi:hypothetical protein
MKRQFSSIRRRSLGSSRKTCPWLLIDEAPILFNSPSQLGFVQKNLSVLQQTTLSGLLVEDPARTRISCLCFSRALDSLLTKMSYSSTR